MDDLIVHVGPVGIHLGLQPLPSVQVLAGVGVVLPATKGALGDGVPCLA